MHERGGRSRKTRSIPSSAQARWTDGGMSATVRAMATKKASKAPRAAVRRDGEGPPRNEADAVQLIAGTLARHEATIRQLAEVVVNLHANVQALREVIEALTEGTSDRRVSRAKARLGRVKLNE
jgi:hypothetical protein